MKLGRLQSFVCRSTYGLFGLPAAPTPQAVSIPGAASSKRPSPDSRESGSFSLAVSAPSEFLRPVFLSPSFQRGTCCRGSLPHRGATGGVHIRASSHTRASFRPRVFATPRRFTPPPVLRACFIPLPRTGFIRPGDWLPIHSRHRLVAGPCPLAVVARTLTDRNRLPPSERFDFEALIREPIRAFEAGFSRARRSLPSSGSSSFGLLATTP